MSEVDEVRKLLANCSPEQKRQIFDELRATLEFHPFERRMNAKAEVILEALDRAGDLTLRGIRGIIGEATFVMEVAPTLTDWGDVTPIGDLPYDCALKDDLGIVKIQVKMQRRVKGARVGYEMQKASWKFNALAAVRKKVRQHVPTVSVSSIFSLFVWSPHTASGTRFCTSRNGGFCRGWTLRS